MKETNTIKNFTLVIQKVMNGYIVRLESPEREMKVRYGEWYVFADLEQLHLWMDALEKKSFDLLDGYFK